MNDVCCQLLCICVILCVCVCRVQVYVCECVSVGLCVCLGIFFVCVSMNVCFLCVYMCWYVETHRCVFLEIPEAAYGYLCTCECVSLCLASLVYV